jgi:AcrR family transcriptional regulator
MPRPTHRVPLNRAQVLDAGVALADAEGARSVSMRSLAAKLGVVPMALYKHVTDKDDLISGMIDTVVAGYSPPSSDLSGLAAVRARVMSARSALTRHPWLRRSIERATAPSPAVLAHMDALAGDLAGAGLSYDLVHYAMHALGHRVWGFSPEAFTSARPAEEHDPTTAALMAQVYPHVVAIAADAAARNPEGACDEQFEFEFTLDLLLAAIERLHASGWVSRQP